VPSDKQIVFEKFNLLRLKIKEVKTVSSHLPGWWGVADISSAAKQACPARQV
jgi:hypothetical protein